MSVPLILVNEPTSPNVANTKLLYTISGSSNPSPTTQYNQRYVMDIYKDGTKIARMKSIRNSVATGSGTADTSLFATFDPSTIIYDSLDYDVNMTSSNPGLSTTTNVLAEFQMKFGELASPSPSASSVIYNGLGSAGEPAFTSSTITIFKGTTDPTLNTTGSSNDINRWNFPSQSIDSTTFTSQNYTSASAGFEELRGPRLSNYPYGWQNNIYNQTVAKPINYNDYETIGLLTQTVPGNITDASVEVYYSDPIATGSIEKQLQAFGGASQNRLYALGVGPLNMREQSSALRSLFTGSWTSYRIDVEYDGNLSSSYWYANDELCDQYLEGIFNVQWAAGVWTTKASTFSGVGQTQGSDSPSSGLGNYWFAGGFGSRTAFEQFNGTSWTAGAVLNEGRAKCLNLGDADVNNNAWVIGGTSGSFGNLTTSELYNGTSWTSGPATMTIVYGGGVGSYASAFIAKGNPGANISQIWNGSSFSVGPTPPSLAGGSISDGASAGTPTSALFFRMNGSSGLFAAEYNGATWQTVPNNIVAADFGSGCGTNADACIAFGGETGGSINSTEQWNGLVWTTQTNMNQVRQQLGGGGIETQAMAMGGGSAGNSTEEFTTTRTVYDVERPELNFITSNNPETGNDFNNRTRIGFINAYGTYDYFTFYLPKNERTKVNRQFVDIPNANYSSKDVYYDSTRRGRVNFYNSIDEEIEVYTNYIDKEEADWLTELLESPFAFEQRYNPNKTYDYDFVPIVITNKSYTRISEYDSVFQFVIRFKRANQPRSRT